MLRPSGVDTVEPMERVSDGMIKTDRSSKRDQIHTLVLMMPRGRCSSLGLIFGEDAAIGL